MDELINKLIIKYKTSDPFELAAALGIHIRFCDLGEGTKGILPDITKTVYCDSPGAFGRVAAICLRP